MGGIKARLGAAGAMILMAGFPVLAPAQEQKPAEQRPVAKDYYQRSLQTYEFRKAAKSGPERGREIFYYKCWFCHNEFAQGAPRLKGVFERKQLLSGRPANEDGIKDEIRNGGAGMAAYKYTLSEADINDLVSFLRQECCWNSDAPPLNPAYRAR